MSQNLIFDFKIAWDNFVLAFHKTLADWGLPAVPINKKWTDHYALLPELGNDNPFSIQEMLLVEDSIFFSVKCHINLTHVVNIAVSEVDWVSLMETWCFEKPNKKDTPKLGEEVKETFDSTDSGQNDEP